jgi:hypothetical protein
MLDLLFIDGETCTASENKDKCYCKLPFLASSEKGRNFIDIRGTTVRSKLPFVVSQTPFGIDSFRIGSASNLFERNATRFGQEVAQVARAAAQKKTPAKNLMRRKEG